MCGLFRRWMAAEVTVSARLFEPQAGESQGEMD